MFGRPHGVFAILTAALVLAPVTACTDLRWPAWLPLPEKLQPGQHGGATADEEEDNDDVFEGEEMVDETLEKEIQEHLTLDALESLGYMDTAPTANPQDRGVTRIHPGAHTGLNLYSSRFRASAVLMDMEGRILHSWETTDPKEKALPNFSWMHVEMQPNGDLLVIAKDAYLARIDWDSNVVWKQHIRAHHDLAVTHRGGVLALTRRIHRYPIDGVDVPLLDDHIALISPDGTPLRRTSIFEILRFAVPEKRLAYSRRRVLDGAEPSEIVSPEASGDVTHTNSIQVIPRAIPSVAPAGSILLSVRELNHLFILDPSAKKVLWQWGQGWLQGQHHATFLDNGNILVFDNGTERRQSRVLEINPVKKRVVWSYTSPGLFTHYRGAAQRLANGNTLITESDSGHVIEVTHDKKVVWEFWNPDVNDSDPKDPHRAAIYRLRRYPRSFLDQNLSLPTAAQASAGKPPQP